MSLVNIGVGPANAKTATDHLGVLRPLHAHDRALRRLAKPRAGRLRAGHGYLRADHVLDDVLPSTVPVIPNHRLNTFLLDALGPGLPVPGRRRLQHRLPRLGVQPTLTLGSMRASRCVAVDMESATIAANGFRYRIPNATLLGISDKPLHGSPKLSTSAAAFYEESSRERLEHRAFLPGPGTPRIPRWPSAPRSAPRRAAARGRVDQQHRLWHEGARPPGSSRSCACQDLGHTF